MSSQKAEKNSEFARPILGHFIDGKLVTAEVGITKNVDSENINQRKRNEPNIVRVSRSTTLP